MQIKAMPDDALAVMTPGQAKELSKDAVNGISFETVEDGP